MNDLDTLRPEVREAVEYLHDAATLGNGTPLEQSAHVRTIRAELLRLAKENADLLSTIDLDEQVWVQRDETMHRWIERARNAEAELAESRETIKRLNRRVQVAEAGVAEKVKEHAGGSLGRALANAAADMYMRERDEAQAELAALKAKIDALMLEFCPDDMMEEQRAEWAARQRVVEE